MQSSDWRYGHVMFPQDLHDFLRTINSPGSPGNGPTSDICAFPGLTSANNMTLGYRPSTVPEIQLRGLCALQGPNQLICDFVLCDPLRLVRFRVGQINRKVESGREPTWM